MQSMNWKVLEILRSVNMQAEAPGTLSAGVDFLQQELYKIWNWVLSKAGSILIALIVFVVGVRLSKWLMKVIHKWFDKSKLDPTVASFLSSIINIVLYVLVVITVVSIMGIQVTSFVTLLGTAGVTLGLALQGSLSNFAGGVLILVLKPFVVGDYIKEDSRGNEGTVTGIDIFYTRLITYDGKMIVIPNGTLSNNSLTNLTKQEKRRLDLNIPIEYEVDIRTVKRIIEDTLETNEYVLKGEPKDIALDAFEDSSMTIVIHVWVKTENYWKAKWSVLEEIKYAFDESDIKIPFNQLDVHVQNE